MKKRQKIILGFIGLVLILITGLVTAQESQTSSLSRAVIKIDTLTCGGCFSTINAALVELEGYSGMGANLFRKLIAVDFNEPLTPDEISQKLIEVGYPGELESVEEISSEESFAYLESKRTRFGNAGGGCCSSGSPGGTAGNNPGSSGPALQNGASCCTLTGGSIPTENL